MLSEALLSPDTLHSQLHEDMSVQSAHESDQSSRLLMQRVECIERHTTLNEAGRHCTKASALSSQANTARSMQRTEKACSDVDSNEGTKRKVRVCDENKE